MRRWLFLLLLTLATPAAATVLLPADFVTVVTGADLIVAGRVVDVRAQLADGSRTIESVVTVAVQESVKGATGNQVTFRVPNGQLGRYRRITVGAPEFVAGDRVVLFLRGRGPELPTLFGLSQGVYRVAGDGASAVVTPPAVLARGVAAERVVRGDPARRPLALPAFLAQVRSAMEPVR